MQDYYTFGELLLTGLNEANKLFEEMQSETRFVESVEGGEEVYDVYMAKKKSGKPKDGEPSKCHFCTSNPLNTNRLRSHISLSSLPTYTN